MGSKSWNYLAVLSTAGSILSVESNQNVESKTKNVESKTEKNVESKITLGQLILRKIIKTLVTRCQIKAKMHQNSALGSLQRSPDPLAGFKGPTSKEREG